ncbi:MAG: cell division protein FtsZ [Hyphomicrobiaceae bacterium]
MSIKLQLPKLTELKPRVTVIGVGGAGGNAVNNMIASGLEGVEFVVANTDAQALLTSSAEHRIQLGVNVTEGLGAGSRPEIGEAAAEEALDDIRAQLSGSHMVFIAAGMGGGTGTGACSVIARAARDLGILVVAVVTKPFQFEGARRMRVAEAGVAELKKHVDTLIVIPNQNLFRIANDKTTFAEAFVLADQVLYSGIACIVDLIVKEGLINLDFADVRTVMRDMGTAMMGTGEASGERRAIEAAEEAIQNPLLDDISLKGAKGLLLSIIGGRDLTLYEVDEAASRVRQEVDAEANIIVGATFDDNLGDRIRVSIVASGMAKAGQQAEAQVRAVPAAAPGAMPGPAVQHPGSMPPRTYPSAPDVRPLNTGFHPVESQAPSAPRPQPQPDDDLRQRISDAISHEERRSRHGQPDPASWGSADGNDVVIEDRPPQLTTMPPAPVVAGGPRKADRAHEPEPHGFTPAPPAEIRHGPPRMPAIEDFPATTQAAYHANAARQGDTRSRVDAGPPAPELKRKPSFFDRLTGRARRQEEQAQSAAVASARGSRGVREASVRHFAPTLEPAGEPPRKSGAGRGLGGAPGEDDGGLPALFNRDRK